MYTNSSVLVVKVWFDLKRRTENFPISVVVLLTDAKKGIFIVIHCHCDSDDLLA